MRRIRASNVAQPTHESCVPHSPAAESCKRDTGEQNCTPSAPFFPQAEKIPSMRNRVIERLRTYQFEITILVLPVGARPGQTALPRSTDATERSHVTRGHRAAPGHTSRESQSRDKRRSSAASASCNIFARTSAAPSSAAGIPRSACRSRCGRSTPARSIASHRRRSQPCAATICRSGPRHRRAPASASIPPRPQRLPRRQMPAVRAVASTAAS